MVSKVHFVDLPLLCVAPAVQVAGGELLVASLEFGKNEDHGLVVLLLWLLESDVNLELLWNGLSWPYLEQEVVHPLWVLARVDVEPQLKQVWRARCCLALPPALHGASV